MRLDQEEGFGQNMKGPSFSVASFLANDNDARSLWICCGEIMSALE